MRYLRVINGVQRCDLVCVFLTVVDGTRKEVPRKLLLSNQLGMVANVLMLKSVKIALSNTLWADFELSVDSVKS